VVKQRDKIDVNISTKALTKNAPKYNLISKINVTFMVDKKMSDNEQVKINFIETDFYIPHKLDYSKNFIPLKNEDKNVINVLMLTTDPYNFGEESNNDMKTREKIPDRQYDRFCGLIMEIAKTKIGQEALRYAYENECPMGFSENVMSAGMLSSINGANVLTMSAGQSDDFLKSAIVHELRHLKQKPRDTKNPTSPFENIAKTAFQEADAQAFQALFAYEYEEATGNSKAVSEIWEFNMALGCACDGARKEKLSRDETLMKATKSILTSAYGQKYLNNCYHGSFLRGTKQAWEDNRVNTNKDFKSVDEKELADMCFQSVEGKGSYFDGDINNLFSEDYIKLSPENKEVLAEVQHKTAKAYGAKANKNYAKFVKSFEQDSKEKAKKPNLKIKTLAMNAQIASQFAR
jgi:hypothetical protein